MKCKSIAKVIACLMLLLTFISCKKYLDKKSNQQLATPDKIEDLRALLDNENFYRFVVVGGPTSSDDYYIPKYAYDNVYSDFLKLGYLWTADADNYSDWYEQYQLVLQANTVLEGVDKLSEENSGPKLDEIKGTALFLRAHSFYQLLTVFAPQYDPQTASSDLGIVLKMEPDFMVPSERATVKQSYDQIIKDLEEAVTLMPLNVVAKTRPNRAAGYLLLARVYLQIGEFQKAKDAADESLQLYPTLIDYNDLSEVDAASESPMLNVELQNKEIIYYLIDQNSLNVYYDIRVDSILYNTYEANDIRKTAFYFDHGDGTFGYKGSYNGWNGLFTGLGTAEAYLIRAEAYARLGKISDAMQDINTLLINRYLTGTVPSFSPANATQAVDIVLAERRKEMVLRGMRWADLKRLNKEPSRAIELKRDLDGVIYTLPANDPRYALLIPRLVMQLSNLKQNPR